jgi:two-component system chemotaxis response regulator CheB
MPPGFTKSLANRLDSLSQIRVKEAEDGELLQKGTAYIAPGGFHLTVKSLGSSLAIRLSQSSPRNGHRPSVDVMFESISTIKNYSKIAVIMTGMGADGSKGLVDMKKNGMVKAIAESQDTSIVFGMPKAAIATNMVDEVANVENIAQSIMNYI